MAFCRPGVLAVPPPGPTGAPDGCEHWTRQEYGKMLGVRVEVTRKGLKVMVLGIKKSRRRG